MAKIGLVPKHVTGNFDLAEAFDLIMTLRTIVRDFEDVPESIPGILAGLEKAYDGDLPQTADAESDDGGAAVSA